MATEQLTFVLWETREALEDLAFALEQTLLFASAGRARHLARSSAAVDQAMAKLAAADQRRSELLAELAPSLGLDPNPSLRMVAERLPEEEGAALLDLRRSLLALLGQVDQLADQLRGVLAQHLAAANDALAVLGTTPPLVAPGARRSPGGAPTPHPVLVDTRA